MTGADLLARTRWDGGCLIWTGAVQTKGYGYVWTGVRMELAHRVAYRLFIGPIPDGLTIDHVKARGCRHKTCVAPAHLEAVTRSENSRRAKPPLTHCKRNHPLTGANVLMKTHGSGRPPTRNCRACKNARARELRALARAS